MAEMRCGWCVGGPCWAGEEILCGLSRETAQKEAVVCGKVLDARLVECAGPVTPTIGQLPVPAGSNG